MSEPHLFALGRVVATPGALTLLWESGVHPAELLTNHVTGDFFSAGNEKIEEDHPVLSRHQVGLGRSTYLVIIETDASRSYTVVMLAEER